MGRMTTGKFMDKTPPASGSYFNLKKHERTVGLINCHPEAGGYWSRMAHKWFASTDEKKEKVWHSFNCVNQEDGDKKPCPLCLLKDFAKREIADGFKGNTVLLCGGEGRDASDFTLAELAQETKDTRQHVSSVAEEIALPWISLDPDLTKEEKPIKLLRATAAVLYGLKGVIVKERKEHGDEGGDPVTNPYPICMIFDPVAGKKNPKDYYDVSRSSKEVDVDSLRDLLDADPRDFDIDLEKETAAGDAVEMLNALVKAWATKEISFESFREFYEKRAGKKTGKAPGKKADDKKADSKKPAGRKAAKAAVKKPEPEPEPEVWECPECSGEFEGRPEKCPHCGIPLDLGGDEPEQDEGSDNRAGTWCEKCQANVVLNRRGRCPGCLSELDVM